MTTLKTLSLSILAILAAVIFSMSQLSRDPNQYNTQLSTEEQKSPYSFDDPMTAYYLLDQLDIFEVLDKFTRSFHYETIYGTFRINDNYCSEHRAHFVLHPELVFNQKKIVSNYKPEHKIRTQVFPEIGAQDLYPQIYPKMDLKANNNSIDLTVDTNMFFFYNLFFQFRFIGLHYSCLSQASNHIPGNHKISRKDNVGDAMVSYSKQYQDRPQCFNNDKFFPKTWVMKDEEQCLDFFEEFNSPRYEELKKERGIVYWRKIGVGTHKGMGVFPVNQEEEEKIRELYQNGELCGEIEKNYLMQSNIHNLFLINGRKFHMRVYLLVASTNPVMAFYHDGYVRLSTIEYDSTSSEVKTFITNIDVHLGHGHGQEEKAAPQGNQRTEDEIQEETTWYWEDLHRYLMEQGLVSDPNWLNNHFRPELKKSMIHLVRMAQDAFAKKSSVYEVYGLDFIMDENLGLWFIEANNMPNMDGFTKESTILINGMLKSLFEIEYGLLKSRMKRVILYINQLSEQVKANNYQIPNLEQAREEFRRITMNRFEPEFLPSPENGFAPIIDENRVGTETYYNLIQEECL